MLPNSVPHQLRRLPLGQLALVLLALLGHPAARAQFAAPVSFAAGAGSQLFTLALADFNGDSRPDVAAGDRASGTVVVLPNTGQAGGTPAFGAATKLAASTGVTLNSLAAGDVNGDNLPDLLAVADEQDAVEVRLNTTPAGSATPSFAVPAAFALPATSDPLVVTLADVNGDNRPDAVVLCLNLGAMAVLLNTTPTGASQVSFAAPVTFAVEGGSQPADVAVGDLNADGKPDMVVSQRGNGRLAVLLNMTVAGAVTASFKAPLLLITSLGGHPDSVTIADFNADGRPDLAFSDGSQGTAGMILGRTATATSVSFLAAVTFRIGGSLSFPGSLVAGDIDGDGRPDLVTTLGSPAVAVLYNNTAAKATTADFNDGLQYPTNSGFNNFDLTLGDVNGDKKPDAVLTSFDHDEVVVLPRPYVLATAAPAAAAGTWLYPNPSAGLLTLHRPAGAAPATATLSDALGRVVRELPIPTTDTSLDVRDLPTGMYLLRLQSGGPPVALRLIRQ